MQTLLNTLYVMTPNAYAHLENATVRIDVERKNGCKSPFITCRASSVSATSWFPLP